MSYAPRPKSKMLAAPSQVRGQGCNAHNKKRGPRLRSSFCATQVYKPGSVLTAIYLVPQLLTESSHLLEAAGSAICFLHGVAPDRVYIVKPMFPWAGWALTPPFHPYLPDGKRYISVALVLRSPSAGVTRYPYPVEPGLSSPESFRFSAAAVRPGCPTIVPQDGPLVKCLAKSFFSVYTSTGKEGLLCNLRLNSILRP